MAILYHIFRKNEPSVKDGYIGVSSRTIKSRLEEHKRPSSRLYSYFEQFDDIQTRIIKRGKLKDILKEEENLRPKPNLGWNVAKGGGYPPKTTASSSLKGSKTRIKNSYYSSKNFIAGTRKATKTKRDSGYFTSKVYTKFLEAGRRANLISREKSNYYSSEKFLNSRVKGSLTRKESGYYESKEFKDQMKSINSNRRNSHPTYNLPVEQYTKENVFIKEYSSIREASKNTKNKTHGIDQCCKNNYKHCGGFVWKYKSS